MSAPGGLGDLEAVAARCRALRLHFAAEHLPELLAEAARQDLTPVRLFDRMLEQEMERQRSGGWPRRCGGGTCPRGRRWDGFDWSSSRGRTGSGWSCSAPASSSAARRTCSAGFGSSFGSGSVGSPKWWDSALPSTLRWNRSERSERT